MDVDGLRAGVLRGAVCGLTTYVSNIADNIVLAGRDDDACADPRAPRQDLLYIRALPHDANNSLREAWLMWLR